MSTYVNTGVARNKRLTITQASTELNQSYNILGFPATGGQTITNETFQRLSEANYLARLNNFITYVKSQHPGIEDDFTNEQLIQGAYYNSNLCKVGETPGGGGGDV